MQKNGVPPLGQQQKCTNSSMGQKPGTFGSPQNSVLHSGKHTKNDGKSPCYLAG